MSALEKIHLTEGVGMGKKTLFTALGLLVSLAGQMFGDVKASNVPATPWSSVTAFTTGVTARIEQLDDYLNPDIEPVTLQPFASTPWAWERRVLRSASSSLNLASLGASSRLAMMQSLLDLCASVVHWQDRKKQPLDGSFLCALRRLRDALLVQETGSNSFKGFAIADFSTDANIEGQSVILPASEQQIVLNLITICG